MKRKISILLLAFLFFAANIGLPFSLHLCKMMDEPVAESCGMCTMPDMQDDVMTMECSVEENNSNESISGITPVCCETQFVDNKISDQFLSVKTEINKDNISVVNLLISDFSLYSNSSAKLNLQLQNNSPPIPGNDIYIYNSVLLI
jgi:hypothetical protein